jgi:hypothetical protein
MMNGRFPAALRAKATLVLTVVFAVLAVLALAVPLWVEEMTGISPDGGNGEFEAFLALPFGLAAAACGVLSWRSRRQAHQRQHPTRLLE